MRARHALLTLTLTAAAPIAAAQDADAPPPPPPAATSGEQPRAERIEPEVRIIEEGERTVEEYSVNGQVYMLKITPEYGPPYYLVDTDGDGRLDNRRGTLREGMNVPQWILFRW